ncbi:MAG: T9SS C-terminal target domain-containing protein [Bacteroidetes bacterium]|nr:T9SS C-terminal target domain-containing protein [Bacteroidota bacterium]
MQKFLIISSFFFISVFTIKTGFSQFAPAAGKSGSSALKHDSSCFVSWAKTCKVVRGFMDISMPDSGYANVGDTISATGKALQNGVLSLGDGGYATLQFQYPIRDEGGWDFAVFENTFLDTFLELAFVEVSSDGIHFVRFPSQSLTDTSKQTAGFGFTYPENVNNLAGKYIAGYGTPFDLLELKDSGNLDISDIRFVRIRDVVGCLNSKYAQHDINGRKINDPWPTRFPSGGFDLDAVGVIHENKNVSATNQKSNLEYFSNPISGNVWHFSSVNSCKICIYSCSGKLIKEIDMEAGYNEIPLNLHSGIYCVQIHDAFHKIMVE